MCIRDRLDHAAEWNLILKKGTLICKEKIQEIKLHSYKYPPVSYTHLARGR